MKPALIECGGCGRHFATADPTGMLAAITRCPTCSGTFRLAAATVDPPTPLGDTHHQSLRRERI